MSPHGSDAQTGLQAAPQRSQNRLRLAVIDRDTGFIQVLANRLETLGWDLRAVSSAVTIEALVAMRLNAHRGHEHVLITFAPTAKGEPSNGSLP
ncbi:MAG: hypothetical protein ACR2JH_02060 [Solirubrobacteraceae bacterium]